MQLGIMLASLLFSIRFSRIFEIVTVLYSFVSIYFMNFYSYLMLQLKHSIIPMFQLWFKKRSSFSFCVLTFGPFEYLFESWVANGAPYYSYFIMQPFFDLSFFFSIFQNSVVFIFVSNIVYSFYICIILVSCSTIFFDAVLYSIFWLFILYGGLVLFVYLAFFLFFFFVSVCLYVIDSLFKTSVAGLVLLSREFIAIEDEDLWISSNIFHMDVQIRKAKDFVLPLKSKEIEAFMTLVRLFFEEPLHDLQYSTFSGELAEFRRLQRTGFLEKKRLRELVRGLTPKRKFRRFKKYKRSGVSNVLLESQQELFLDKTSLNISQSKVDKSFYKFLVQNLRFYSPKPPTKKKRLKRLLLLKNRVKKQRVLALRFKERATFNKKLNFVSGLNLTTDKLLPPINDPVPYMKPQVLRNDFVKPYLVPRVNLKDFIFGPNYEKNLYNQHPKISRFRRFLWFSLPFYLSVTSLQVIFMHTLTNFRRFFVVTGDWCRSKFLSIFFAVFEDSWAMGQFRTRNYSPRQTNLVQFLRLNNLSFVPLGDNPENPDDGPLPATTITQQSSLLPELSDKLVGQFDRFKLKKKQEQPKTKKASKNAKTAESKKEKKESEKIIQKKKLKKKAYRKRLRRKRGTTRKNFLVSRQRYHFSNISNVAGVRGPEVCLLHLYKLLEYFYFVLTNDADFYEVAMFSAKVALLRDKYGQAIVTDLLNKADHKQASKVSVIMHVTEEGGVDTASDLAQTTKETYSSELPIFGQTDSIAASTTTFARGARQQTFRSGAIKGFPHISKFSHDLLLSYRYRFRL